MKRYFAIAGLLALLLLQGCAQMSNSGVNNRAAARANARLGLDFFSKQHYELAQEKFKRALRYDNNNIAANWGMALLHQALGEPDQARSYYQRIMGRRNIDPKILNSYAIFLCKQGEMAQAMPYFERAADSKFNDYPGTALANAGVCQERAGDNDTAERYYRQALQLDSDQLTALTKMATIQYARGNNLSARAFIERADAAGELTPELLLLAARIELALGDVPAAQAYLRRHNQRTPAAAKGIEQLRQAG